MTLHRALFLFAPWTHSFVATRVRSLIPLLRTDSCTWRDPPRSAVNKIRHQDRLAIVRPQIQATLKRLQVFVDLENQVNDDNQVNYKTFKAELECLELLDKGLEELVPATSSDVAKHLQSITWGCAAFKNIEFKHLHRDFDSNLKAVADAFDKQYFGWFDVVDSDD